MHKVSVITTVWNVEEWLDKNINCFINQTLKDIELILINDCSPDNSINIINKYLNNDNIKLINNEKNLGPGISRQIGLDNSTGEYTIFVDGDDWLELDCLEIMYNEAINKNADIVSCSTIQHNIYGLNKRFDKNYTYIKKDYYNFINNKLIKRDIWNNTNYSPLIFREDINTLFRCLLFSKNTIYLDYAGYNYNLRPNSLTSTKNTYIKNFVYIGLSIIENLEFKKNNTNIVYTRLFNSEYNLRKLSLCLFNINIAKNKGKYIDDYNKYIKEIDYIKKYICNNKLTI